MSSTTESLRPKAVLVSVQLQGVTDAEQQSSLKELKRLCETLGFEVAGEVTQKRKSLGAATLLGEGKLVELAAWTGGTGVVPKGPPGKKKAAEEDDDETERLHLDAPRASTGEPKEKVCIQRWSTKRKSTRLTGVGRDQQHADPCHHNGLTPVQEEVEWWGGLRPTG